MSFPFILSDTPGVLSYTKIPKIKRSYNHAGYPTNKNP
jgi:hypothetical protein